MNESKTETLSVRIPVDVKTRFLELFDQSAISSKPELFKNILDSYIEKDVPPIVEEKEQPLPSLEKEETPENEYNLEEVIETELEPIIEEKEEILSDIEEVDKTIKEITLKLNPVQLFALRETILNEGFIDEVNRIVEKVDNAKDTSFFGNDLFSGNYKGIFSEMTKNIDSEEAINENVGIALINHFISSIVFGACDLNTPVTQNLLKEFLKEKKADNSTLKTEPKQL